MKRTVMMMCLSGVLLMGSVAYSADEQSAMSPVTPFEPKIMGGYDAPAGAWPWMTALLQSSEADVFYAQYCGGALIAPNWVLTAGHCVDDFTAAEIDVAVGVHDLKNWSGTRIGVKRIVKHPDYVSYAANDIALLELQSNSAQTPVTIYSGASEQNINPTLLGLMTTLTGWGLADTPTSWYYPSVLQQVELPVVANSYCNNAFGVTLSSSQICAGYNTAKDACGGDSGGPLMLQVDGEWTHVGLVSYGANCKTVQGYYGVYTRTSSFVDFIKQYVPAAKFTEAPSAHSFPWLMLLLKD